MAASIQVHTLKVSNKAAVNNLLTVTVSPQRVAFSANRSEIGLSRGKTTFQAGRKIGREEETKRETKVRTATMELSRKVLVLIPCFDACDLVET